jgi:inorganic pyrophosphatase
MSDQGQHDEKVIAVCTDDPFYNSYHSIEELPGHLFAEIRHFYEVYKMLENKHTSVEEVCGQEIAAAIIQKSLDDYNKLQSQM